MNDFTSVLFHNPINHGGGHYVKMSELMAELVARGKTVLHVSPDGYDDVDGVKHIPHATPPASVGFYFPFHLLSVLVSLLWFRPDRFVPFSLYGGFVGAVAPGTTTILFVRGDTLCSHSDDAGLRRSIVTAISSVVEWLTFRMVDRIVFLSDANRETMIARTGLEREDVDSHVLYNNLYTDRVESQLAAEERSLQGNPIIGFAGELPENEGKGVRSLLESVEKVEGSLPELKLYILGDGQKLEEYEAYVTELGIADRVSFEGWVDDPIRYMQSFDLFVLPSHHEGLGNSLLEALACGTPVAGSDVGGIPEVVGDERLLFTSGDPDAIADILAYVFADETQYKEIRERQLDRREKFDFDWPKRAIDLIKEV